MKKTLLLLMILGFYAMEAQVTFIIDSLPAYTPPEDELYIAGSFNGWNPGDINNKLDTNDEGLWEITLDGFSDGLTIDFKFTRGDWSKVEKGPNGEEINNREFTFGNGDTVNLIIYNWADQNGGQSTAAENVIIMDEEFEMPQLNRFRRIWLYLPPDYDQSSNEYPVLYMHDGQNLFDQFTSFAGEWEIDETLNRLVDQGYKVPIVVGIDNGGIYRIDELTPWNNPDYGGGQGDEYMAFIVETLKPFIDENYRTLSDRENTGIMGSSLGGLISTYGALKYQNIFSKAGPFSPAYWINNDSIWNFISSVGMQNDIWFYQNVGEHEGDIYINNMYNMEDSLRAEGFENITSKVILGGDHNEQTWRNDFEEAYLWLFMSFANNIKETNSIKPLVIYPNPATEKISFRNIELNKNDSIRIVDSDGHIIKEFNAYGSVSDIDISDLKSGIYIISVIKPDLSFIGRLVKL